jgi:hypothetical protein
MQLSAIGGQVKKSIYGNIRPYHPSGRGGLQPA